MIALAAEDEDEVAEVKAMDVSQFKSAGGSGKTEEVKPEVKTETKPEIVKPSVATESAINTPSNLPETKILISPSAKAIFETNNLTFKSAFSHKFITKIDALNMIYNLNVSNSHTLSSPSPSTSQSQSSSQGYKSIPVSTLRKVISDRLTESKTQIPHMYAGVKAPIDALMAARKAEIDKSGRKFSLNDVMIKAVASALQLNKAVIADGLTTSDISVAVASKNGLITPIVPQAEDMDVHAIADKTKELIAKAQEGKLASKEFQGGAFTISNLGMFGVTSFSAIINPPQKAILAIGGPEKNVEFGNDCNLSTNTYINLTLSYDGSKLSA